MLYITTRDKHDTHTANKTLTSDRAADGGLYLPRSMPHLSGQDLSGLRSKTFNETFALLINAFFSTQLTGWDVDFSIGRNPVSVVPTGRKILVAQTWRNPERKYAYIENHIFKILCKGVSETDEPTPWLKIAVRIALIFSIYGQLLQAGHLHPGQKFDIAVDADDYISAIAVFYAAETGLPLGKLICGCDDTEALWDFAHLGEVGTASVSGGLSCIVERLIHAAFGADEVQRFLEACRNRGSYRIPDAEENTLTETLFCAVVGKARVSSVTNSYYRTDDFLLDASAARSFGAVQDYRAKTGSSNLTLLFSDRHPVLEPDFIMNATGLSQSAFFNKCKTI